MKIKGLFLFVMGMCAFVVMDAHAGQPQGAETTLNSKYTESHSTMTVSSATLLVATLGWWTPRETKWRQVTIDNQKNSSTDIHYRADGSTANISVVGNIIKAGTEKTLETNATIYFQLEAGTAPVTIRLYESKR
jgi:hypothetical protein